MADLPDLDTRSIGYISYFNVIDNGADPDNLDVSEATSSSSVLTQELYDNGIEGDFDLNVNRDCRYRMKQDGWFIMYIDRTNEYVQDKSVEGFQKTPTNSIPGPIGYWDVISDFDVFSIGNDPRGWDNTTLAEGIEELINNLSISFSITFSRGDVGIYNYEFSNATTSTVVGTGETYSPNQPAFTVDSTVSYTTGTDILYHSIGAMQNPSHNDNPGLQAKAEYDFEGSLPIRDDYELTKKGTIDALANNLSPEPGTSYTGTLTVDHDGRNVNVTYFHLILWG